MHSHILTLTHFHIFTFSHWHILTFLHWHIRTIVRLILYSLYISLDDVLGEKPGQFFPCQYGVGLELCRFCIAEQGSAELVPFGCVFSVWFSIIGREFRVMLHHCQSLCSSVGKWRNKGCAGFVNIDIVPGETSLPAFSDMVLNMA